MTIKLKNGMTEEIPESRVLNNVLDHLAQVIYCPDPRDLLNRAGYGSGTTDHNKSRYLNSLTDKEYRHLCHKIREFQRRISEHILLFKNNP